MEMKCKDCRYWSEMVARSCQGGVESLCLSCVSPLFHCYTLESNGCGYGVAGLPVDAPENRIKGWGNE